MTKLASALDAAITYAGHGLRTFPLKPRSKEPATSHGFKDATLDGGVLMRRFGAAGADANVGIATGDGLIVIDLDGPEAEVWASEHEWPKTWIARTARGRHLYFTVDRPVRTRPQQGGIGPKVDVKGEGGYVLAPPSVHPDGPVYAWTEGHAGKFRGPIAPAPPWLLALLDEPRERAAAPTTPSGAPFPEGGRNAGLTAEAGRLRRRGLSQAALEVELQEINRARCSPPLDDEEVRTIARSVGRYPPDPAAVADERLQARSAAKPQKARATRADDTPEAVSEGIIGRRASEVQAKAVRWLWKGRLPAGMLVILDGDPGLGKSTIVADWIARVTTGKPWPDGERGTKGGAIYVGAEDPEEEVVVPRLRAAGADLERVQLVRAVPIANGQERSLILPKDLGLLEAAIRATDARLLVFDPIVSYIARELSSYSDMEVRQALTPLGRMLAGTDCCGVMLRHLKKDEKASLAMYRGGGSIAFIALARAGFAVGKLKGKDGALAFMPTKSNLAPKSKALRYELEQVDLDGAIETSRVVWKGDMDADADEVLTAFGGVSKPGDRAQLLLQEILDEGPRPSAEIEEEAAKQGISLSTLRRAKEALNIRSRQVAADRWWNALPEHAAELQRVGEVRIGGRVAGQGGRGTVEERVSIHTGINEHPSSNDQMEMSTRPYTADNSADGPDGHSEQYARARTREDGGAPVGPEDTGPTADKRKPPAPTPPCPRCGDIARRTHRGRPICAACALPLTA